MIRTILVDDEPLARKRLAKMLAPIPDVEIVDQAGDGPTAVEKIEAANPHLLLLDVQMPEMDGFEVIRMLQMDRPPAIIFVTAYDQYAIQAFEANALDYLLKPIRMARLEQAISRVRERLAAREGGMDRGTRTLPTLAERTRPFMQRLPVRAQKRILILNIEQVTSLRIDQGLVSASSVEGEFWTRYTSFGQLEDQLDPNTFMRVHRQSIVNLNHVREVNAFDNSTARLTLSCGRQVNVSRAHMRRLREALNL